MKKNRIFLLALAILFLTIKSFAQDAGPITIDPSDTTRHGPRYGSLIIIGGGGSTPAIWKKFTELAGGKDKAKIVFVTNGTPGDDTASHSYVDVIKKETGIKNVTVFDLHNIQEANNEKLLQPLREATGIFFDGGRQWRIADVYLNTLAHQAFNDVLKRGGVIAGSSAGATIQGSFLWRGDTKKNNILIGDHTQGLGFLKNSVIDQHLLARNRQFDLVNFIKIAPQYIGLGLDQATAVWVHQDTLEVLGKAYVAIYDYNTITGANKDSVDKNKRGLSILSDAPFFFLKEGQRYDLKRREIIPSKNKQDNSAEN